jgi:NADH dehydrogenase (ubiquinone) 1 alpha/beta subcomplex 1
VQRPVLTRVLSLQVTARVLASIQSYDRVDASKVTPTSQFGDLGLDSLDQVRLLFACS